MENKSYVPLVCMTMVKEKELSYETKQLNGLELIAGLTERLKYAILNNGVGIILFQNHPSGDCKPREENQNE